MDEDALFEKTKESAEKARLLTLETSLSYPIEKKIELLKTLSRQAAEETAETLSYAPNFVLLQYNQNHREHVEHAIESDDLEALILALSALFEILADEDGKIECALREGDGDFEQFLVHSAAVAITLHSCFGVIEALQLERNASSEL